MSQLTEKLEFYFNDSSYSQRAAIVDKKNTFSYAEVSSNVQKIITLFHKQCVKRGDKVAVNLPNGHHFIFCYLASLFAGFTIVPINQSLPAETIDYILKKTQPKIYIEAPSQLTYPEQKTKKLRVLHTQHSILGIFFTSGTTGLPKGVCHTVESLLSNAQCFNELHQINHKNRAYHVMPMGYMAGFLNTILCPLIAGGTIVIGHQFNAMSAMSFWETAMGLNANSTWLSPSMINLLTRIGANKETLEWIKNNFHHIFVGTAPLLPEVKKNFEQLFKINCLQSYGSTEMLLTSCNTMESDEINSVGKILRLNSLKISDENEILIKSPCAFKGYLIANKEDMEPFNSDNWFSTKDCGYIKNNLLHITGRLKDLIIHGGINVSPSHIENALLQHKFIMDAAVVGKPHSFWGEEIIAFIVLEKNSIFEPQKIIEFIKSKVSRDALPSEVRVIHSLPRSSTGKIQKQKLRDIL